MPSPFADRARESRDAELGFTRAFVGVFAASLGVWTTGFVVAARSGLEIPARLAIACPLVLAAAALAPSLLAPRAAGRQRPDWRPGLLALGVLVSLCAGLVAGPALLALYALLGAAGAARALPRLRSIRPAELALLALGPFALAVYLFLEFHGRYFAHVYTPELARMGAASTDTLFHSAIAHMIDRFGVASTGLDGLRPIHYHVGSHVWFAALVRVGGAPPLFAYPFGQLGIALPALVLALVGAVAGLSRSRASLPGALVLASGLVLLADLVGWNDHYTSESQTLGVAVLLFSLPLLIDLLRAPDGDAVRTPLLLAVVLVAAVVKVSAGAIAAVALCWVALRRFRFDRRLLGVAAGLAAIACFAWFRLIPDGGPSISLFAFYRTPPPPALPAWAGFTTSLIPALCAALLLYSARSRSAPLARRAHAALSGELVLVVTAASLLPGFLLGSAPPEPWWFANTAQWFALPLLVSRVESAGAPVVRPGLARAAGAALLAGCALLWVARVGPARVEAQNAPLLEALGAIEPEAAGAPHRPALVRVLARLAREGRLFDTEAARALGASNGTHLLAAVELGLSGSPPGRALVFARPTNREVWGLGTLPCFRRPLLVPALTGRPLLRGLAPGCPPVSDAYSWGFAAYGEDARAADVPDEMLCGRALARGFDRVLVLESLREPARNRVLVCRAGGGAP